MDTFGLFRRRSKSMANVAECKEFEEDDEDLLPGQWKDPLRSTLDKWKSTLNLNFRMSKDPEEKRSRAGSMFTRPPAPRRPRRQSLADVFRRPVDLKNDIKRIWERRPSLSVIRNRKTDRTSPSPSKKKGEKVNDPCGELQLEQYRTLEQQLFRESQAEKDAKEKAETEEMPVQVFYLVEKKVWNRSFY